MRGPLLHEIEIARHFKGEHHFCGATSDVVFTAGVNLFVNHPL